MELTMVDFKRPVTTWFDGIFAAIPDYMRGGLTRYVVDRVRPGGFLTAVITNSLDNALARADDTNKALIDLYVQWFRDNAPDECFGSAEKMDKWLEARNCL